MLNRDLFECVCLAFAAMLVILALGFPRGCSTAAKETQKKPAQELKEQRKSLKQSCENLMLVRLLVEAELRKAEKQNANRARTDKKRSAGSGGDLGSDGSPKASNLEARQPGLGTVRH